MQLEKPNIILLGGGGHCMSVIDVIEQGNKYTIKGILDYTGKGTILGYPILGGDDLVPQLVDENTYFLVTVGQIKSYAVREKLTEFLVENNAKLATVISPLAYVSKHAQIQEGTVVMHGAIVNAGASIGKYCIINTKALIEHGAVVEDFCHISTSATINGDTIVKRGSFIGSNATISHLVCIPEDRIISAGTFIKRV
ncbi:NeuD/PglB/VioB family sugar acetyltransferase [Capnocytophaga canis]|uniref:NeuD/PglB/VioB family sugar acetyltransferase n=1 Tax=Capnocytophaga canis TaxID=1848903 RepID=UPI0015623191|nr:NeuD/PglB/VioB family sugar acetyltransferase [Capnocytophaga canis]